MPRVRSHSRLRFSRWTVVDGIEFWDLLEYPELLEQVDDIQHTVVAHDRLDLLADQYYGDSRFKFVIALANDIELEPTDFNVGDTLRIPSPRYVREVWQPTQVKF